MHAFDGEKLVIATHNQGKLREFAALLAPCAKVILSANDLHLPEPEETGTTFEANALLKAAAAAKASNSVAVADDSGLCVNALNGEPGLLSARFANNNFPNAMKKLHEMLGSNPDRSAYFICVLALAWPDGAYEFFEGRVLGHIVWPPRGDQGHGYDPFFVPNGHTKTFGEVDAAEKHALSHRGIAVNKLAARLCRAS